jgi:hypothetical protein
MVVKIWIERRGLIMVYVEIWMGGLRNPAHSFMATKTEITNDGNVVRLYATNGDVFETSIHNVVMQILGEEKEKLSQPK